MTSGIVSRRNSIGLLSGAIVSTTNKTPAASAQGIQAAQPRQYEFASDADLIHALIKMRSRADGNLNFSWLKANRYCYIDGEIHPLLSLVAGFLSTAHRNNDGTYTISSVELTYYTDFKTGELLDVLEMPTTGQKISVPLYRSEPRKTVVAKQSSVREVSKGNAGMAKNNADPTSPAPAFAPPGDVALDRSVGPAIVAGDSLSIRTSEYGRLKPYDKAFSPVFYKESAIWTASLKDILNDDVRHVQSTLSYSAADSWRPWMKMGNTPGHTMGDGIGGKVERFEDLPSEFLEFTRKHYPDVIRDPKAAVG